MVSRVGRWARVFFDRRVIVGALDVLRSDYGMSYRGKIIQREGLHEIGAIDRYRCTRRIVTGEYRAVDGLSFNLRQNRERKRRNVNGLSSQFSYKDPAYPHVVQLAIPLEARNLLDKIGNSV